VVIAALVLVPTPGTSTEVAAPFIVGYYTISTLFTLQDRCGYSSGGTLKALC
jgi:hypothetical protein